MALTSELIPYDPRWPSLFESERARLATVFGADLAEIHHVGSTSVPGMLAKPEIDTLVVLAHGSDPRSFFEGISALGYDIRGEEPGAPGHWYFSKDQSGIRTHKLHVCIPGHPCIEDQLLFRDYLTKTPERAKAYAKLKSRLAERNSHGMIEYLASKKPFIEETLALARDAASSSVSNRASK